MSSKRQIKLGVFLSPSGHHEAAWRHPDTNPGGATDFEHFKKLAQLAEKAKFDTIFTADSDGFWGGTGDAEVRSRRAQGAGFEPITLYSALSSVTKNIGFVATASTTYNEPWHIARKFASLDQISGGRAAWNVVTSGNAQAAFNFGLDGHPDHGDRYRRATEFVEVVKGLWDSWEDDALLYDKENGVFSDPAKLHELNHVGEFFRVKGPLNVARSPQGHPVLVQAGASEPGRVLAARTAEAIFAAWQTLGDAQSFYRDVKSRAEQYGRDPDHIKILPGVYPVIGRTEQEALDKKEQLRALIHPQIGLSLLASLGGLEVLRDYDLDGPVPQDLPDTNNNKSRRQLLLELAARENLSIRELYEWVAGARGHRVIHGTPDSIADQLEEWFLNEAADGFNLLAPTYPTGLVEFSELVIPILQKRGLFRTEYEASTLRGNLGLPIPQNRYAGYRDAKQA
ncbi:Nitrilotriacetate monooxygenase component A [Andreprevotia sp. IGB-42]|uniref:LLM class flavin-dependent oxidoreductase n=1 Tax=Andreprevotia sp. IGB-42 TaxID=2497473 RepID=UPI00135AB6A8|nr:LLM class flavin-dependent oxidoreductase [Andreprevotia sp. IGB-42]KAF0815171.1 Nitrilotriacetate monooxygenase component A [Andreprevotia sp. IGB-42]